jgi:hypothetical protein
MWRKGYFNRSHDTGQEKNQGHEHFPTLEILVVWIDNMILISLIFDIMDVDTFSDVLSQVNRDIVFAILIFVVVLLVVQMLLLKLL